MRSWWGQAMGYGLAATAACASGSAADPGPETAPIKIPVSQAFPAPQDDRVARAVEPSAPEPPPRPLPADYLAFTNACTQGEPIVSIGAVGDLLLHRELQRQAFASAERYRVLWSGIADLLRKPDVTYANLEGPMAFGISRRGEQVRDPGLRFDNNVYSGYAKFNYHPSLAQDLARAGLDIVSTANNHALDRGALGIDRTLEALDAHKVKHTGTRHRNHAEAWHAVTEARGLRIAWLACTKHTNRGKDLHDQVLRCYRDDAKMVSLVEGLTADPSIDAVVVTPHWGKEYSSEASDGQRAFAQRLVDAGASAVIGSHPHVLQPWEILRSHDGREALVVYSLGNFLSHQRPLPRRSTILLYFGLRKNPSGPAFVVGARYVPMHVRMKGDNEAFFVEAIDRSHGPADSRALTVAMFGESNLAAPDEPVIVNPHCDSGWAPPRSPETSPQIPDDKRSM